MKQTALLIIGVKNAILEKVLAALKQAGFSYSIATEDTVSVSFPPFFQTSLIILISEHQSEKKTTKTIRKIKGQFGSTPVLLIAIYGGELLAVSAFRAGVSDYFNADFSIRTLLCSIRKQLCPESAVDAEGLSATSSCTDTGKMIGKGPLMQNIKASIAKFAPTDCTVLITGETGTGKELAAEMIHLQSSRYKKKLVCMNCAALPDSLVESELFGYHRGAFTGATSTKKGKFELASGGTLFLDEMGDMSHRTQAKILRAIENKTVYPLSADRPIQLDVRVIAATNQDPEQLVSEGNFRRDLYYRLNVARIHLPPLRERKEDLSHLVHCCLAHLNRRFRKHVSHVSEAAMSSFYLYDWPGNIRELKNTLEIALINCNTKRIEFSDLPTFFKKKLNFQACHSASDRDRLLAALSETHWNKSRAAKKLNWSRMRVYRTMAKYRLKFS